MALAPFWMDDCFTGDPDKFDSGVRHHRRFQAAVARAKATFLETQEGIDQNPGICGAAPSQAARVAFLQAMGLSEASEQ